jgi:hypothetical protein
MRSQAYPCRGTLRSRGSRRTPGESRSPRPGGSAGVDHSAFGGPSCGGFRAGFCCAQQRAPGRTLCVLRLGYKCSAVLYEPASPASVIEVKDVLSGVALTLGFTVQFWEVRGAEDFEKVFAALTKQRPDGLYAAGGALINAHRKLTVGFALKSRLPSMYGNGAAVNAGGLMYYGANLADSHRRVATYLERILKGAKPADLPVEQPTKFEFVINLKAANQIGVIIPAKVLARADKVIK